MAKVYCWWFADGRPINAQEIGQIVYNYRAKEVHKEFIKGTAQVTKSKQLKEHFERGVEIYQKHLDILQSILSKNHLPKLPTWENEVLETTIFPFSYRLMHFKHAALMSETSARSCIIKCDEKRYWSTLYAFNGRSPIAYG
ncbi:DUF3231 family protein [Halobacillus karajensis]|uniref:DUF3231 family protein n=1 Tax=Halobacillus karajensis TaxID=195088 RepID=UPI0009F2DB09